MFRVLINWTAGLSGASKQTPLTRSRAEIAEAGRGAFPNTLLTGLGRKPAEASGYAVSLERSKEVIKHAAHPVLSVALNCLMKQALYTAVPDVTL